MLELVDIIVVSTTVIVIAAIVWMVVNAWSCGDCIYLNKGGYCINTYVNQPEPSLGDRVMCKFKETYDGEPDKDKLQRSTISNRESGRWVQHNPSNR